MGHEVKHETFIVYQNIGPQLDPVSGCARGADGALSLAQVKALLPEGAHLLRAYVCTITDIGLPTMAPTVDCR